MRRPIQSLLIAAAVAAFACAPEALATTITSANCNETGIRNAVASHSAIFEVNCSITLMQGPLQIPPNNALHISTMIKGNGFTVTLSGGNKQGVIDVPLGATLYLSGVTIANGQTLSSTGGGIANSGSLSVSGCMFMGNTIAIQNNGTMSVTNSTFTGNIGFQGGAIIHTSPIKAYITNSAFGAPGNGGGSQGGAIYISGASAEIDGSSFIGNKATQGGAIYAILSTVTLNNVYFQGNITNPGGTGGAIANMGSSITITNPYASLFGFQANQASRDSGLGGAIYNAVVDTRVPSLQLNSVFFQGNSASNGGAIYILGGAMSVVNSYFLQNSAQPLGQGGAIDNAGMCQRCG